MSIVTVKDNIWAIDLESNDEQDIFTDIRPFVILNTIAIASNIADTFLEEDKVKETHIYDNINEYLDDVMERIFDDVCCILDDNNVEIY